MAEAIVSDDVALRIAFAARALQGIPLPTLIDALHGCLGNVLDEAALARVTVANLKASFGGSYDLDGEEDGSERWRTADMAAFKEAVRILWGEPAEDETPVVDAYRDGDMPRSVRVAMASNRGEELNGHFGSAESFLVYQVSAEEIRLLDVRSAAGAEASGDKNTFRVNLIRDCRVLYIISIGGPASAKVIKADIHLISLPNGGPAREVLRDLQRVIATSPPPWLAKVLGAADGERVKNYRDAGSSGSPTV
ncbi:MAG: dinitrogenase iron-molybdenum cofactor biosynthesis protein [Polyangiaceae bacterium]